MTTLYWHDYETWGTDPSVDRACQFAGVRTNDKLEIVGEPLVIYCRPPADILPRPEACLVTGISPQEANRKGLSERAFIARIHEEFVQPQTCVVGYNSLRFDDEVTRYMLYRNYYDPYEREWRNGNSRWDIIDMVRLTYALRPEGIEWPMVDGAPSFKLENICSANGIGHERAHDAYSDVEATIALARLVLSAQPNLYHYAFSHRSKKMLAPLIHLDERRPLLHISSRFPAVNGCASLIAPVAMHPTNKNAVIVFDLRADPEPLAKLSAEQIRERVFVSQDELPDGESRIPLKLVHLNKCPILATPKLLDQRASERLNIDKSLCEQHWYKLRSMDVVSKLSAVFEQVDFAQRHDAERKLYEGFVGDEDKGTMAQLRQCSGEELARHSFVFHDERLNAMLLPYKARNFPESLSPAEQHEWQDWVMGRLQYGDDGILSVDQYLSQIAALSETYHHDAHKLGLLKQLYDYVS